MDAYREKLQQFVYHSGTFMKPDLPGRQEGAEAKKRIVYAEGEEERVLRAVQVVVDEKLARPSWWAVRPCWNAHREVRPAPAPASTSRSSTPTDDRYRDYWQSLLEMTRRKGVTEQYAKLEMRRRHADRFHDDPQGRRRRHDLRHLRHHPAAPALHRPGAGQARRACTPP
jgi:malate dehydrogenase (oxaloacetate-decarboxylating)(NADP+)